MRSDRAFRPEKLLMSLSKKSNKYAMLMLVIICSVLLSLLTVAIHARQLGIVYLEIGSQFQRHLDVLQGTAIGHWQYRVLPDYLVEILIQFYRQSGISHPVASAFTSFRFMQGVLIFLTCHFYYRRLGLSAVHSLMGLGILAWGMTHANHDSDLQFNLYFDVFFYLAAGIVIINGRYLWIIPITILAALNRETSGLIPVLLLACYLPSRTTKPPYFEIKKVLKRPVVVSLISLALYIMIVLGLRAALGPRPPWQPYGYTPGFFGDVLSYNLFRSITWIQVFATLGIMPILALMSFKKWPRHLKVYFWVIVPFWFFINAFYGTMAESRLFLVPQAMIFIPGALFLLQYASDKVDDSREINSDQMQG
jgi:hypothetical protein